MTDKIKNKLFIVFSILIGITTIYHLLALFMKLNDSPPWRHILFVFVGSFCIYGLLKRPKFFIYFFFLLIIQQLYSHGGSIINVWHTQNKIDWSSVAVVIIAPLIFICLIADRKQLQQNKTKE